jgi:hypothetical protein
MKLKTSLAWALMACCLAGCGGAPAGGGGAVKVELPATPDGSIQAVARSVGEGKPQAIWSALPPKYQADVKGLITDFASKMDKEVWDKTFVVLGKITKLAKDKKEFILNHPGLAEGPLADKAKKDEAIKEWDAVVQMFEILVKSDISTIDGLKKLDPEKFLGDTVAKFQAQAQRVAVLAEKKEEVDKIEALKQAKVTLVKTEGDKATLKMELPGEPAKEKEFTKVEGKWLPSEMVAEWDNSIKEAKKSISNIKFDDAGKGQFLGILGQVETVVDELLAAKTQGEFNASVDKVMGMVGMMFGGGPPGGGFDIPKKEDKSDDDK